MALVKNVLITVKGKTAKVDTPIYLYLGDGNITLSIKILEKTFAVGTYNSLTNLVTDFGAKYASVCLLKPNKELTTGEKCSIVNGRIIFEITKEFVDQITEEGKHLLLIHLYDAEGENANRYTVPPVAFEVLEPICNHGGMEAVKAVIDSAGVDVSRISSDVGGSSTNQMQVMDNPNEVSTKAINTSLPVFNSSNEYIMTDWETGEIISEARMDKIERGIYFNREDINAMKDEANTYALKTEIPTKVSELTNDSNFTTESQVDTKIANAQLGGGGSVDLSGYATKTELTSGLADKVDKVTGKSLVSDAEIARLANVDNYDDTQVKADIALKANKTEVDTALALKADKSELHTHDNKTVLDGITADKVTNWDKAEENIQADWNEIDTNSDAFILNKPTNLSEFTNDSDFADKAYVDEKIADAVTGGTVDLSGYLKKTELPTETLSVTTTAKTIPGAINELDDEVGTVANLTTTAKDNLVNAVNELDSDVGDKSTLTTTAKGNLVSAVNELDDEIGDLSTLTTEQSTVVGAINELDDDKLDKADVDPTDGQILSYDEATQKNVWIDNIEVVDNLTSTDTNKALSANQGKVIIDEWLGGKKLVYLTQAEYDLLTDDEKQDDEIVYNITDVEDYTHTHDNKDVLDTITETKVEEWNDKIDSPVVDGTEGQILSLNATGDTVWIDNIEVINDLTTGGTTDALSAEQGKVLRDEVGALTDLTTSDKDSIVEAINSLVDKIDAVQTGGHYELSTQGTDGALEIVADDATVGSGQIKLSNANNLNKTGTDFTVGQYVIFVSDIDLTGYLKKEELQTETITVTTTAKTIPGAINELDSNLGDINTLTTTANDNLVDAINELDGEVGNLTTLTTTEKTTLVGAVNELDNEIGTLTNLTTTANDNIVNAINELDDDKLDKPEVDGTKDQILTLVEDAQGNLVPSWEDRCVIRETLTATSGSVTMTDADIQNLVISSDTIVNIPNNVVNKAIDLNITCNTNDAIVTFVLGTEVIKTKLATDSYNVFEMDLNETDVLIERLSTDYPTITEDDINNGVIVDTEEGSGTVILNSYVKISDVVDNLTSTDTDKPLSANQGKILQDEVGALTDLTTTAQDNLVESINELDAEIGKNKYYEISDATDALEVVADDADSFDADTQIKISDANQYGGTFQIGDKVIFVDSTGIHNDIDLLKDNMNNFLTKPEIDGTENQVLTLTKDEQGNIIHTWEDAQGGGLVRETLTVENDIITMTDADVQSVIISNDATINVPIDIINKAIDLNITCETNDCIVTFVDGSNITKVKLKAGSYNVFEFDLNETDIIMERLSTDYPEITEDDINNGVIVDTADGSGTVVLSNYLLKPTVDGTSGQILALDENGENVWIDNTGIVIDNLTSTDTDKALSANQGRIIIDEWLDGKKIKYLTQEEYNALTDDEKQDDTIVYNIVDAEEDLPVATTTTLGGIIVGDGLNITTDGVLSADSNVQSDWNETDTTSDAYILNKPDIPTTAADITIEDTAENYVSDNVEGALAEIGEQIKTYHNDDIINNLKLEYDEATGKVSLMYKDAEISSITITPGAKAYTITNNLTNVTTNNSATTIAENASYNATLTPATGYVLGAVTVSMGGTDITTLVYSDGVISIPNVTGNLIITADGDPSNTYSITNNLTNVINSNTATEVEMNSSYTATLTPNSGYIIDSVTITMAGNNVTNTVYADGNINISNVTGNVIITASATMTDAIGTIAEDNTITIDSLDVGNYILKYENDDGVIDKYEILTCSSEDYSLEVE